MAFDVDSRYHDLDDLYKTYKTYLRRKRTLYYTLALADSQHDDAAAVLYEAYTSASQTASLYKSRFLGLMEELDDEEGYPYDISQFQH